MDLSVTPELAELRRTVRDFLAKASPEAEVRRLMDTDEGYDADVWRALAADLGLAGLALPERYGGAGCGFVELGVVLEEAGRALLCAPILSTVVLAAPTLLALGDEAACADYLPAIAAGETVATLALTEPSGLPSADAVTTTATRGADGWRLTGTTAFVLDGHTATLLLVPARTGAGLGVFAVEARPGAGLGDGAPGLRRRPQATLDQTRRQATLTFDATPARLLGEEGAAGPALSRVLDLAAVATATEQAGGAARVLDMAVDYAKTRVQFGRPIGSFQAVKHKLADLHLEVESARSAAYAGLWAADEDPAGLREAASLAKACCGDAFVRAAAENIQVHGGIGVTWEHPGHLYFKRAHGSAQLFGNAAHHRQRLAELVLAGLPD
ncbi:acyl-CoA/acyl-ACP dehydrogenase [Frankia sp. CNm7]|uniref:Acyl-CoA/acyl-ACP dehydrogenase n=1 Tax=Frankia nepalensis TaxID=1836974 RepID=A0A937RM07_9ACTN|nr:acyl-CoA dehydrogenase family protein [Frankia nepalensis]MBL7501085.1 acyl-CoA/acyl-ACP dehydrogenase [Frankia nepalensis]MBL7514722.1 acyl-CoA/acyl-ACP dehydrogenase [Frankia nepalensis]MBL7524573.1 acyl-CoA/acyl-ACP dehydrogenase [Frankia nepalensis]MBL7631279.1 acyl-CoA/acyl-ACP dehydrogenase [Frankia nepalensis]